MTGASTRSLPGLRQRPTTAPTRCRSGRAPRGAWSRTEDWRSSDPFVVAPSELAVYGLHWDTARARAGQAVTLEVVAGGGSGALEYRFVQFEYATGRWSVVREVRTLEPRRVDAATGIGR